MKKIIIGIVLLCFSLALNAQRKIYTNKLVVKKQVKLSGYKVDSISNDTLLEDASPTSLVTEFAVKKYIKNGNIKYKNTLFVSRLGDNSTAEREKINQPYFDIWAARDAANEGDLIHVLDGVYTYGNGNVDAVVTGVTDANLMIKNLSYHLEKGVVIKSEGSIIANHSLFNDLGIKQTCKITGAGSLASRLSAFHTLFKTTNDSSDLFVQLDEVVHSSFVAEIGGISKAAFRVKDYYMVENITNPAQTFCVARDYSDDFIPSIDLSIEIENFTVEENASPRAIFYTNCCNDDIIFDSAYVDVKVRNTLLDYDIPPSFPAFDIGLIGSLTHDNIFKNSFINFDFGNVLQKDTNNVKPTSPYYVYRTSMHLFEIGVTLENTTIKINCDNCVSAISAFNIKQSFVSPTSSNSFVYVTGRYRVTDDYVIVMDKNSLGRVEYFFDGNYVSDKYPVITDNRGTNPSKTQALWTFQGLYETKADTFASVALEKGTNIVFENATLKREGTGSAVTASQTNEKVRFLNTYSSHTLTENVTASDSMYVLDKEFRKTPDGVDPSKLYKAVDGEYYFLESNVEQSDGEVQIADSIFCKVVEHDYDDDNTFVVVGNLGTGVGEVIKITGGIVIGDLYYDVGYSSTTHVRFRFSNGDIEFRNSIGNASSSNLYPVRLSVVYKKN